SAVNRLVAGSSPARGASCGPPEHPLWRPVLDFPHRREGSGRMHGRLAARLAAGVLLAAPPPPRAPARPGAGAASPLPGSAAGRLADPAIAPPFPDLGSTGATLVINGGAARGQCYVSADLPAARWTPLGGDGARRGWRYRDPTGAVQGVRRVIVRPGAIA